jgi:predicted RNase H-like HicB family nuclease
MSIHREVLSAALRMCSERKGWTFRLVDVVRALPHLNPNSVRTHVVSRCCVNAPRNHPHKWDYFRRIGRGSYEVLPPWRNAPARRPRVEERRAEYGPTRPVRDTIHVAVHRSAGVYFGEALEIAVVSQGRSLDELVSNMREAIILHLEAEDPRDFGLTPRPRIAVTFEDTIFFNAEA